MTDPVRLRDAAGEGSPEGQDLLRRARASRPMSAAQHAEMAARVAKAAAGGAGGSLAWLLAKGFAAGGGVGLALALGYIAAVEQPWRAPARATIAAPARRGGAPSLARSAPVESSPAPVAAGATGAASAVGATGVTGAASAPSAAVPGARAPSGTRVVRPTAAAAGTRGEALDEGANVGDEGATGVGEVDRSLDAQQRMVDRARERVVDAPAEALARVEAYQREFPQGALRDESEVVAVDALLRLGRGAEANARGAALIAREPRGIYVERVRALLQRGR